MYPEKEEDNKDVSIFDVQKYCRTGYYMAYDRIQYQDRVSLTHEQRMPMMDYATDARWDRE